MHGDSLVDSVYPVDVRTVQHDRQEPINVPGEVQVVQRVSVAHKHARDNVAARKDVKSRASDDLEALGVIVSVRRDCRGTFVFQNSDINPETGHF